MKHFIPIIIVLIGVFLSSCANQSSPQGGPRDTIPPTLVSSIPEVKTLNFTSKEFQFVFDERISADQLTSKLIITPRTENKFKAFVKKNKMTLTFEESFEDSTTYTLNFADGVVDITEKNPVENFAFAFSTGPVIDSIYIQGRINNLYNNKVEKNILIALFDISDTLNIFTGKPKYFTKTNELGDYKIENIKNGFYRFYAFLDENNNLTNDPTNEQHGFLSDTLDLNTSKDSVNVKVQLIDASQPKFVRAKTAGQYFDLLYNKFCSSYSLQKIDSTNSLEIPENNLTQENKIIRFYKHDSFNYETDSLQLAVNFVDSLKNELTDTVFIKFKESKRKPAEFTMKVLPSNKTIKEAFKLGFIFSKPIDIFNKDSLTLRYDTLDLIDIPDSTIIWNHNRTQLSITVTADKTFIPKIIEKFKAEQAIQDSLLSLTKNDTTQVISPDSIPLENESVKKNQRGGREQKSQQRTLKNRLRLNIAKATFISVESDSSELKNLTYNFIDQQEFGKLSGTIQTEEKNYTLQLTDPNFDVIGELRNPVNFQFNSVEPGKYTFRILIDKNGDGVWSPGNILKNIEPEPIWFYSEIFDLRANWEVENLDISF